MKQNYKYINNELKKKTLTDTTKTIFGMDIFKGLCLTLKQFFKPSVTIKYPLQKVTLSKRYRAVHKLQTLLESQTQRCIGCGLCEKICTSNCIRIITSKGDDGRKKIDEYSINFGRCIYCGLCAEVCPELAIVHGDDMEHSGTQRAFFSLKDDMLSNTQNDIFDGFGSIGKNASSKIKQSVFETPEIPQEDPKEKTDV